MGNDNLEQKAASTPAEQSAFSDDLQSVWGPDAQENQSERQVKGGSDLASAEPADFQNLSRMFKDVDPALAASLSRIAQKMEALQGFPEWQQDRNKIMGPSVFAQLNDAVTNPSSVTSLLKKMSDIGNK